MVQYSDGGTARPFGHWVRTLGGSDAFDAAIRNGHVDEVSTDLPLDNPPF